MSQAVLPTQYFKLETGHIIKDIIELSSVLETMDDATYLRHVTADRNDFAAWVKEVFHLNNLSEYMRSSRSRQDLARLMKAYVAQQIAMQKGIRPTADSQKAFQIYSFKQGIGAKPAAQPIVDKKIVLKPTGPQVQQAEAKQEVKKEEKDTAPAPSQRPSIEKQEQDLAAATAAIAENFWIRSDFFWIDILQIAQARLS
jgi:hypothetical protein